jgi:hypothetical protein
MSHKSPGFLAQLVSKVLTDWGLVGAANADEIAMLITGGTAHWETTLPDGQRLALVRLFAPVAQREEVFLGNVLFNDFLSKALVRAVERQGLGQMAPVANDLENYYYLLLPTGQLDEVVQALRQEVTESLLDLYFTDENPTRGIYGDVERMLSFYKSNVEPFPLFIIPTRHKARLESVIREQLLRLLHSDNWLDNLTTITALLAFFYSRDGREMQSPPYFLSQLVYQDGFASKERLHRALNVAPESKELSGSDIKKLLLVKTNPRTRERLFPFDEVALRELLLDLVGWLGKRVKSEPEGWLIPYVGQKFLSLDEETLAELLLSQVQLGYQLFPSEPMDRGAILCRVCGTLPATLEDKSILMGIATHRFHCQSAKQRNEASEKICVRCALFAYLTVKLLGSTSVGQPQVPKQYNVIFHYGQHDETETEEIAAKVDLILRLATQFRTAERIREELRQLERQREAQTARVAGDLLSTLDDPYLETSCEVLGQMYGDVETEHHVLGLGYGGYRLMLFILPQLKWGGKEGHDFVQKRFSKSRIAAFTLLAFLRRLCGCDGPYYFQSLPTLAPGGFDHNTFYVRNRPISVREALDKYKAITSFARRVVKYEQGRSPLVEWILLAERFLDDPLGTFSDMLRDSPLRGGDDFADFKRRRLGKEFIKRMGVFDSLEYLSLFEKLKEFQEVI